MEKQEQIQNISDLIAYLEKQPLPNMESVFMFDELPNTISPIVKKGYEDGVLFDKSNGETESYKANMPKSYYMAFRAALLKP